MDSECVFLCVGESLYELVDFMRLLYAYILGMILCQVRKIVMVNYVIRLFGSFHTLLQTKFHKYTLYPEKTGHYIAYINICVDNYTRKSQRDFHWTSDELFSSQKSAFDL